MRDLISACGLSCPIRALERRVCLNLDGALAGPSGLWRNDLDRPEHGCILAGGRSADTSSRQCSLVGDRWHHLAVADLLEDATGARNDQAVHVHADETGWRVFEQVEGSTPRRRLGSSTLRIPDHASRNHHAAQPHFQQPQITNHTPACRSPGSRRHQ